MGAIMNGEARVLLAEILEDLVYEAFNNIHTNLNVEQLTQLQERMADLKKILTTEGGSL